MKRIFGIILIIIGALWTLLFLLMIADSGGDGELIIGSLMLMLPGIAAIVVGVILSKNKNPQNQQGYNQAPLQYNQPQHGGYAPQANQYQQPQQQPQPQQQYNQPQQQYTPAQTAPQQDPNLTMNEIRALTAQKVESVPLQQFRLTASELSQMLFNLNEPRLPFEFRPGNQNGVDMIVHWKLADAEYLGILGLNKHKQQEQFDVLMKFDEPNFTLRCKDKMYAKQSSFGIGGMGMEMSSFSGKSTSMKKEIVIGRKKDGTIGKVVDINLDTRILHDALKEIATKCGWEIKRVAGSL